MSVCPWCREALPTFDKSAACPKCAKPLVDAAGARLRPLDLDFEKFLTDADAASLLWTKRGAIFAFVLAALSLVTIVAPFTILILILGQFFWGRFFIARRYTRHFAPLRRMVTRWISRLVLVLLVSPAYAAVGIPGLGLVVAPLVFGGTCLGLRAYFRFHFLREHRREGVTLFEKAFLVLLAFVFVVMMVVVGLLVWAGASLLPGGK
ncbi:MAG: hypothetical protein K8T90_05615 [Planctomycetes bacterium]|nr:hypothetical protein [Planctomycetota bacterium]